MIWKSGSIRNIQKTVDRRKEYSNAKLIDPKSKPSKFKSSSIKSAANINAQKYHSYSLEKTETAKISIRSPEAPEFSKGNENFSEWFG